MTKQILRIGIAGLGRLGKRHAANLAHYTRHTHVDAAASPVVEEREWAKTELEVPRVYENFEDLLNDDSLDALVLATPTNLHASQTIAALKAGKHVFVEKPLAMKVAECLVVEEVAKAHPKQVAMVGFMRRFDASYRHAKKCIDDGVVGRPFMMRSQTCDMTDPSGFFVRFAPTSGGIFMDCSVHDFDAARWLLGGPKKIRATRAYATGGIAVYDGLAACGDIDHGQAVVEFDNGARAMFYVTRISAHGVEISTEIMGTQGKLTVSQDAPLDHLGISDGNGMRRIAPSNFYERFVDAFRYELQAFVDACIDGTPLPITLNDATEATRIAQAVTSSFKSGQAQDIA